MNHMQRLLAAVTAVGSSRARLWWNVQHIVAPISQLLGPKAPASAALALSHLLLQLTPPLYPAARHSPHASWH